MRNAPIVSRQAGDESGCVIEPPRADLPETVSLKTAYLLGRRESFVLSTLKPVDNHGRHAHVLDGFREYAALLKKL